MLEKPPVQDKRIIAQLWQAYGLPIAHVEFLPLGADSNTAVYRVVTEESVPYFLKLRRDNFEETSLVVPQFLHEQGIRQVIPPRKTRDGQLSTSLDAYTCILYPFIAGCNGFEVALADDQWLKFGSALKGIHTVSLPPALRSRIPSETYSPHWREVVRSFQAQVEHTTYADPVAAKLADIMQTHREEIRCLIERAGQLASQLASTRQSHPPKRVLCHSDIHAGNLLLSPDAELYIVDWDNPILAPKERDLMFIGAGVGRIWNTVREEDLFYQGYGSSDIDQTALTYYRYERIVQDIAAYCEQILLTGDGGADREQGLYYFTSQFLPNDVLDIAYHTDQKLNGG